MRLIACLAAAALAACTSGNVTVPADQVIREVPPPSVAPSLGPSASSSGGGDFVSTIGTAIDDQSAGVVNPGAPPTGTSPLDDDVLNLTLYTIEQQKIDARVAEQQLAEARSQLVIVQPGSVPQQDAAVNIALFAQQTRHPVGERVYQRSAVAGLGGGGCRRYRSADDAQRAFLAAGGPDSDRLRLDPDGDGFACSWDPQPYRDLL